MASIHSTHRNTDFKYNHGKDAESRATMTVDVHITNLGIFPFVFLTGS